MRHGRIALSPEHNDETLPKPRVSMFEIDFRLDGEVLIVTPETDAAAKLGVVLRLPDREAGK